MTTIVDIDETVTATVVVMAIAPATTVGIANDTIGPAGTMDAITGTATTIVVTVTTNGIELAIAVTPVTPVITAGIVMPPIAPPTEARYVAAASRTSFTADAEMRTMSRAIGKPMMIDAACSASIPPISISVQVTPPTMKPQRIFILPR